MTTRRECLLTAFGAAIGLLPNGMRPCSCGDHEPSRNHDIETFREIDDLIELMKQDGNWDYNEYMLGMTNGMILIHSVIHGCEPQYLDPPEEWSSTMEAIVDAINEAIT